MLAVSALACCFISYQSRLEREFSKPFKYKRILLGSFVAITLAVIVWGTERIIFADSYIDPTLADYVVKALAGIVAIVSIVASVRMKKRAVKGSEDTGHSPQTDSVPS